MCKYHVVCHDCTFEEVRGEQTVARALVTGHSEMKNHNIEYRRVE